MVIIRASLIMVPLCSASQEEGRAQTVRKRYCRTVDLTGVGNRGLSPIYLEHLQEYTAATEGAVEVFTLNEMTRLV